VPKGGHCKPIQHSSPALSAVSNLCPVELTTEDLDNNEVDDNKEAAPVNYSAPYHQAHIDLRHKLLYLVAALDHNTAFTNQHFLKTVRGHLAGAERLADNLADLQACMDLGRKDLCPSTWGRNGLASLVGFHTVPPKMACELQAQRTAELQVAGLT
jgi:hypothetical protein